jgi:predicted small lipoprotein YifL
MRKSTAILVPLSLLALALSACGKKGELQRAPGMTAPPLAFGENKPKTSDQLLEPSTQATPERSSEILVRSEVRGDDPFDIPPGGTAQPFPGDEAAKDAPKRGG